MIKISMFVGRLSIFWDIIFPEKKAGITTVQL
jgi:hypothetical protein